mmetsp:Transcript_8168/g.12198  ORF Transcript_8168/g.12198 Transcript_8168/m.12198 type:complete len:345 (+) Transcript_8168:15-1049(+)
MEIENNHHKIGLALAYVAGTYIFVRSRPCLNIKFLQNLLNFPNEDDDASLLKSSTTTSCYYQIVSKEVTQGSATFNDPLKSPPRSKTVSFNAFRNSKDNQEGNSSENSSCENLLLLTPMRKSFDELEPIVKKIGNTTETGDVIVLGIAGGSGSGKTTLAKAIYESLGESSITFISHDSYYKDLSHLSMKEREKTNFDHPDSLDTDLLVQHLIALKNGEDVCIPCYDYASHSRKISGSILPPRSIILLEGILIFNDPNLYKLIDVKIFVDTDDDIRLIRRIQRDTVERGRTLKGVISQYINTVRPMHLQFVEPSKRNADIIVPVGLNSVALDLVVSKLKSVIGVK